MGCAADREWVREADRQVECWFVVTAADRMAGGLIIVVEADRSKSYYLTTIILPDKLPPPHSCPTIMQTHYGLL